MKHPTKETAVQKVFKENNFFYDVPMTVEENPPLRNFPWLKPSDFLRAMATYNDLSNILGGFTSVARAGPLLEEFWHRYKVICPEFELFHRVDPSNYKRCIPLYLHGDEGVTFKKGGVLVMSFQSPLGFGTSKRPMQMSLNLENLGDSGFPLNFVKCGMLTRMVCVICPKDWICVKYGVTFIFHDQ